MNILAKFLKSPDDIQFELFSKSEQHGKQKDYTTKNNCIFQSYFLLKEKIFWLSDELKDLQC